MNFKKALETIGLTNKEASVYLALLQLGDSTVYVIAEKAEQKRPTTYVLLESLINKGCVKRVPRFRKQHYQAVSPEEVFAFAEEQFRLAKEKLPALNSLTKNANTSFNALYYSGKPAIKKALRWGLENMKGKKYVGFYAHAGGYTKEAVAIVNGYLHDAQKYQVKIDGIAPEVPSLNVFRKNDESNGRKFKSVSFSEYSSEVSIDASDDHVRILDLKNMQGIIIENPDVAKTVQQIFTMLWKRLT